MSRGRIPAVGQVVEVPLPDGRFAYGRVMRDSGVAFYRSRSAVAGRPPIGEAEPEFIVGVAESALRSLRVVGKDPFDDPEEEWPPAEKVRDPLTGAWRIYHRGEFRRATADECADLETAAVWDLEQLVHRLGGVDERTAAAVSPSRQGPTYSRLAEVDGDWRLTFPCGELPADTAVTAAGHEPNGYFWDAIAQFLVPELVGRLDLDSEAGMFCAYGGRGDLEGLQAVLEPLLRASEAIGPLIEQATAEGIVLDD